MGQHCAVHPLKVNSTAIHGEGSVVDTCLHYCVTKQYDRKEFGKVYIIVICIHYFFFYLAPNGYITKEDLCTFLCNFTNYWLPGVVIRDDHYSHLDIFMCHIC
jgi:hypothetical protein